jgi:carboxylesterase
MSTSILAHTPVSAQASGLSPLLPGAEPFLYEAGPVGCLLIHGFTSTPFEMRGLGRFLADRGITAGAWLLAGHGTRPEDLKGKTWHDWYASVGEALDCMRARCDRVYVVGLSLGGALALYAAAHRGRDLAGVVAMSAPIYLPRGLAIALRRVDSQIPYLKKPYRDIQDPAARARHVGYMRSPVDATASLIELLGPVRSGLRKIAIPALIIYSRHDHVVPNFNSHFIYSRLGSKDKQLAALDRGFHIVTVDTDCQKVYAAIADFIREREGAKT